MEHQSSWLPSLLSSLLSAEAAHKMESRVTRLEVHKEQQEDHNYQMGRRLLWLERGLQAVVTVTLTAIAIQAPEKADQIARLLLGLVQK